ADTTAQREAGDAGGRIDAASAGEPVDLGGGIEFGPRQAGLARRGASRGVDDDSLHSRNVNYEARIDRREPGNVVPAGTNSRIHFFARREAHGSRYITGARASNDRGRPAIDHSVPQAPSGLVFRVRWRQDVTADLRAQFTEIQEDLRGTLRLRAHCDGGRLWRYCVRRTRTPPPFGSQSELAVRTCPTQVRAMTSYGQFCPVALAAEIFAERWTPLILRELLPGERSFSDLHRGVPRISRNLLTQRLESLGANGIIEQVH